MNVIGSFRCKCKEGFAISAGKCVDINECENGSHDCTGPGSKCVNKQGSFKCVCGPGYLGNGYECAKSKCPALRESTAMDIEKCTATGCT